MRIAALLALVLFSATAHGAPDAGVDRVLAARIDGDRSGVCVVAVVVVRQGDGAFAEQRADRCATSTRSLPASPAYRFEIGSISKAFTGVLLSEMAERKELSLDDTVQQHLPAGVTMPRFEGLEVTLRDLVTHTSGLPALPPGMRPASPLNPYADVDEKLIVGGLSQLTLTHPPGEQHAYSNWAFMLLSDILGRRAGQPYDALLTERVLAPLGMKDTVVADNRRLITGPHLVRARHRRVGLSGALRRRRRDPVDARRHGALRARDAGRRPEGRARDAEARARGRRRSRSASSTIA